jgi:hypothetical protein
MKVATGAEFGQPHTRLERLSVWKGFSVTKPKKMPHDLTESWGILLFTQGRLLRGIFDNCAIAFLRRFHSLKGPFDRNQFLTEDTDSIKKALKRVFMHCVFFDHDDTLANLDGRVGTLAYVMTLTLTMKGYCEIEYVRSDSDVSTPCRIEL